MKIRSIALLLAAATMVACDGLKEALTAHVDVAARVESNELSVTRLSDMMGNSTLQIPVNRDIATLISDLWSGYQLVGVASARDDSLKDGNAIDEALRGMIANIKLRQFMEKVGGTLKGDSASEATYNQAAGGVFVARHILFPLPGGATQQQKDSVRRVAEGVRARTTSANFADLAKRHSSDPGSAQRGGDLGAFQRAEMVKPFSDAVAALRPGDISTPVETQFGYHIIQRPTYAAAKAQYDAAYAQSSGQRAESVYVSKIDADARIEVKSNAPALAKEVVRDMSAHREDDDVMATFRGGDLDVGRFVSWIESYPPQMRLPQQLAQAPDSIVRQIVKSIARQEVMLKLADSAGITLSADEKNQLHGEFRSTLLAAWQQLGIDPKSLGDSARSAPERERLASSRVEAFMDRVMAGQAQPLSIPPQLRAILAKKYEAKTYPAGVDRAVERAKRIRAVNDSTRAAQQPSSQVPLPTPPQPDTAGTKRP
ncbi:MAG: peptidylprolyl isomerase [Gemmatimonadaceae bacterium]